MNKEAQKKIVQIINQVNEFKPGYFRELHSRVYGLEGYIKALREHTQQAIYIILYGDSKKKYLLYFDKDINWSENKKFDKKIRAKYFEKSSYDTNVWILKEEYRNTTNIQDILK